jgi:thiamine biosynthesis lipoprotein
MIQPLPLTINKQKSGYVGRFSVMASPCEILIDTPTELAKSPSSQLISSVMWAVYNEAKRIEQKFSRYVTGNTVHSINNSQGASLKLDEETARLIDFAFQCYQLSDGLFDITSGVLRKVWTFDGSGNIPHPNKIKSVLNHIGLNKVTWSSPNLILPAGMELDFGGIGKEYAVDRCLQVASEALQVPILINFGGDLACNGARYNNQSWQVGIESVGGGPPALIRLPHGALATSGDARRFLIKDGVRYSHILNPITGSSVMGAPSSITIAASTCIEAGLMSTLAMLQGREAETFLKHQDQPHWIQA